MRTLLLAVATAAAFVIATPARADTVTPYQSASQSSHHIGYSETQIDANRLRVTFTGASGSSRESVEASLLYRAAELTLQRGFDYFVVVDHSVDANVDVTRYGPPLPPIAPRRFHTEARYAATSDILLFKGVRPANAPTAFDARAVQANLAASIARTH
jgi:hypothetical protein